MTDKTTNKIERTALNNSTIIQANKVTYIKEDENYIRQQESYFREIFEVLKPDDNKHNIDVTSKHRFSYEMQLANFCGRSNEIKKLQDFLNQPNNFLWWAITGHAGSGKSRLAYEFALQQSLSWLCCFFTYKNEDSIKGIIKKIDFEQLYSGRNILIIVDYVSGREIIVKELIDRIATCSDRKIRILLLERENCNFENKMSTGSWVSLLSKDNYLEDRKKSKLVYNNGIFLELNPLSTTDQEEIIKSTFKRLGKKYKEADIKIIQKKLIEIDPGLFRPLYLQMLTETWGFKTIESKEDLLILIIEREQNRWERIIDSYLTKTDKYPKDFYLSKLIQLMVFVNSMGELKLEDNPNLPQNIHNLWGLFLQLVVKSKHGDSQCYAVQNLIKKLNETAKSDSITLYAFQPDIIREYMFLYYLSEVSIDGFLEDRITLDLLGFSNFLYMVTKDFPTYRNLESFLFDISNIYIKMQSSIINNEDAVLECSKGISILIAIYANINKPDSALPLLVALKSVYNLYPCNKGIVFQYSTGIFVIIWAYSETDDFHNSLNWHNNLKALYNHYSNNEDIVLQYLKSLFCLILSCFKINKTDDALPFLIEFKKIISNYPCKEDFAIIYSKSLYSIIGATTLLLDPKELYDNYSNNEDIVSQYAKGLCNIILGNVETKKSDIAFTFLLDLKALNDKYSHNEDIALLYVASLYNIIRVYTNINKPDTAITLLRDLKELNDKYSHNEDIALRYAEGLFDIICAYNNINKPDISLTLLRDLKELNDKYSHNEDIALQYAKGLVNTTWLNSKINKLDNPIQLLPDLKTLYNNYFHNEGIALQYATGLANIISAYSECDTALSYLNELEKLLKDYPENSVLKTMFLSAQNIIKNSKQWTVQKKKEGYLFTLLLKLKTLIKLVFKGH